MNVKLAVTLTMLCVLGAVRVNASVTLKTVQDAYIDGDKPTSNFGTDTRLRTAHEAASNDRGAKSYIRFDASGLADAVTRIESFSVFWASDLDRSRAINLWAITKGDCTDADWTETGITWNTAPANAANVGTNNREFVAGTNEKLTFLGSLSTSGGPGFRTLPIGKGSPGEAALLKALNTGNRKVTIGMSWASTNTESRAWRSREYGDGSSAAYLQVQTGEYACITPPQYDLNSDCSVNLADLVEVAFDWMENNRYAEPIQGGGPDSISDLTVSGNHHFLVHEDGQPFFFLADTAWELFHRLTREEASLYLEDRAAKGFNVIMAVALAEIDGLNTPNAYGHKPLLNNDPTTPDVKAGADNDYWDHVDYVVNKAGQLGMYIGLLPTWGDKWNLRWGVGPEIFTPANAEVYGDWIGQRYKDAGNIIWILGGDRPIENDTHFQIIRAMAQGLAEGDGGRYLKTYHPNGGQTSSTWFHGDAWLDFNMMQSGHNRASTNYVAISQDYARTPTKPVIDGEPAYEYPPGTVLPDGWQHRLIGEREVRRNAYWAVFAGALGHAYGTHPIWQMYDEGRDPKWYVTTPWYEALDLPGVRQLVHLKRLMLSRPFLTRIPDQSVIVLPSPLPTGISHIQATRDGQIGTNNATYLMVYFPEYRQVTLNTACLPAPQLIGWWFNPRTGAAIMLGGIANTGTLQFAPPTNVTGEDWVLVLDDASQAYPSPGWAFCTEFPQYDLDGDCRVNLADFLLLASEWLDCDRYPESKCFE